ncbi:MAG: high-affinity nickel-transporter [Firmicutes bacterium]|nr:high-affinity nickel-transporter [Bacillota bacterium]
MDNKKHKWFNWMGFGMNVALLHLIGIACLLSSVSSPTLFSLGFLAYTLGLRHAFDADHIVAIDNTIRKLVQQKKNAVGVGFYFSLGHSTVVFLMTVATIFVTQWTEINMPQFKDIGGIIGTTASGVFLILIGILNLVVAVDIYKVFINMRQKSYDEDKMEELLHNRGLMARFLNPLFNFVSKSSHVYPIGFLFGLGFDTASEVALLAISAGVAKSDVSITGIMALPILFAAGMSLLDTADGVFMTTTYKWAFNTPLRKVYYNLTVTSMSVIAALLIGTIELAQVITSKIGLTSGIWKWVQSLDVGAVGYILVVLFVLIWMTSYGIWKFNKIEESQFYP